MTLTQQIAALEKTFRTINPEGWEGPATKFMQSDYVTLQVNIFRIEDALEILDNFLNRLPQSCGNGGARDSR